MVSHCYQKIIALCFIGVLLVSCGNSGKYAEPLPEVVDFNFHVRPILVQNCYLCHGPDPSSRKANLRLDTYEGATALLEEGGHAIVPKKPNKSNLVARINHKAEDQMMPPPESNLKLTNREKALLEKWIKQGAEWKDHWAFIQPKIDAAQTYTVDNFIDQLLENKDLEKSPLADKNTLIRRVSYLLTGLPPSVVEIENFVSDNSNDAYEKLVDTYLNSPAFGERWARHWMDLVRYAETKGHEFDFTITGAWKYRDYLIRAFNEDIPYDQLLKEHLAGDLLKTKRYNEKTEIVESTLGTAFYTFGEGSHSPVDVRQQEADRIDNMIDVTSKTFQGLTVSCAKCHDHKFDPITAADYYAFYGIMESTRFSPVISDFSKKDEQTLKEIEDVKTYMQQLIVAKWTESGGLQNLDLTAKVENSTKEIEKNYSVLGDFTEADFDGWNSNGLAFGSKTTLGNPIVNTSGTLNKLSDGYVSSKTLGTGVFGALRSPNFTIDSDFIGVKARGARSVIRVIIDNFQLIQNPIYGDMEKGINSEDWANFTFNVGPWKGHKAYIEIMPGWFNRHDYKLQKDAFVEAKYAVAYDGEWPKSIEPKKATSTSQGNGTITKRLVDQLNQKLKKNQLPKRFPELKIALDSSATLAENFSKKSFIYGVNDGFGINSPVFNRGSYKELSEAHVARRFLSALPKGNVPFMSQGSGRLELANAMLNKENPLTSRVMVNRIWHHLFGKGIVETVDNFGLQGKLPTHPELLDYLALKFQNEGWSIKKLIKEIVTTDAFKRSTIRSEELLEKDPTNIYLASFPVRRLESEAIRDGILAATQSLNDTMYGPPVATHLTKFMEGRGRPEKSGPLDGNGRRSIYQEVRRNFLDPMMTTFDRPMPFSTFGKRDVTNVPSQSLIIMNDPFVAKQAEVMAQKLLQKGNLSTAEKIEWIYTRTFSRKPTDKEIEKASDFIKTLQALEHDKESELDQETMIWATYCHSIFNLKEFIYLI